MTHEQLLDCIAPAIKLVTIIIEIIKNKVTKENVKKQHFKKQNEIFNKKYNALNKCQKNLVDKILKYPNGVLLCKIYSGAMDYFPKYIILDFNSPHDEIDIQFEDNVSIPTLFDELEQLEFIRLKNSDFNLNNSNYYTNVKLYESLWE